MNTETSLGLTLFVKHGRAREASDFYVAALGGEEIGIHTVDGEIAAMDMLIGGFPITVCGANPKREQNPSRGGPFSPTSAGAVTSALRLYVDSLDDAVARALSFGASVRDPIQMADDGRRTAVLFDPCGHLWALMERRPNKAQLAA
jgi:PhnB protein